MTSSPTTSANPDEPLTARGVRALLRWQLRDAPVAVRLWTGEEVCGPVPAEVTLVVHTAQALAHVALGADLAAMGRAYVRGDLDVEGNLEPALTWLHTRRPHVSPVARARAALANAMPHHRDRDMRDVRSHDDAPVEFFRTFLDSRLVYSCAHFTDPRQSLDDAQERKLDLVCRKLRLHADEFFLDVGCGWGGLVVWAAKHYGVRARGITLSDAQAEIARASIARAGLAGRATVDVCHYGDIQPDRYDKIASVGMVEHVGVTNYPAYFDTLFRALRPGGLLLNHGITTQSRTATNGSDFLLEDVFPGAEIDDIAHTVTVMTRAGFELLDLESLRRSYALTLRAWDRRFRRARARAAEHVSERVLRTWDLYLPGCAWAFDRGILNVYQSLATKADDGRTSAPLGRDDVYR